MPVTKSQFKSAKCFLGKITFLQRTITSDETKRTDGRVRISSSDQMSTDMSLVSDAVLSQRYVRIQVFWEMILIPLERSRPARPTTARVTAKT